MYIARTGYSAREKCPRARKSATEWVVERAGRRIIVLRCSPGSYQLPCDLLHDRFTR